MQALITEFGVPQHVSQQAFALAAAAGLPNDKFIRAHTLLPYLLAGESQTPEEYRGYRRGGRRGSITPILSYAHKFAYFCQECHQAQRQRIGHAYWLREHQLPGIFWCPTHGTPLHAVETRRLYEQPPLISNFEIRRLEDQTARQQRALKRFADISTGFLSRARRKEHYLAYVLISHLGAGRLVSDQAMKLFPTWWLENALPNFQLKVRGESFPLLDGFLEHRNPLAFAIALSVLFDSAEVALATWFG